MLNWTDIELKKINILKSYVGSDLEIEQIEGIGLYLGSYKNEPCIISISEVGKNYIVIITHKESGLKMNTLVINK